RFADPVGVDDSFDVPTNSIGFPLNVLANDIEGQGGALVITSISTPNRGGTVTIGTGGQSIRYTPVRGFGGTETFTYTATDGTGKVTTANVTIHTLEGARADDIVEFSFGFFDLAGNAITRIPQGQQFRVAVYVDDLRPERGAGQVPPVFVNEPGVYSAYLDMLYSSGLVAPVSPNGGGGLDFNVQFANLYPAGRTGSAQTPGVINELGAFAGQIATMNNPSRELLATLLFTANSAGLADFIADPADLRPQSDVTVFNRPSSAVPVDEIRYGRARLEIVPSGTNFPIAKDDSPVLVTGVNIPMVPAGTPSVIDVLANDIVGSNGPIRITSTRMTSSNGQVVIIDNGARVQYLPNTNFTGTDQFEYTITDQRGFTSTATVTLNVGNFNQVTADDDVELRLQVTDMNGNPITQVAAGQPFQLRGFVKDLRESDTPRPTRPGVFAAYQDILFSNNLVSANVDLAPFFNNNFTGSVYRQGKSGDVFVPGLINELGSFQDDSSSPLGFPERLQWVVNFTAGSTLGRATFVGDPADVKPFHDTLLFDPTTPLLPNQVRYSVASVQIVAASSGGGSGNGNDGSGGTGSGSGFTNMDNAYDVNADGFVSPIDVLIIINSLNSGAGGQLGGGLEGSGEEGDKYYVDVNADGFLDPLDVLAVINFLNTNNAMSGEGEGSDDGLVLRSGDLPLVDLPFHANPLGSSSIYDDISLYGSSSEEDESEASLASMLYSMEDEEDDYLDSLASDLLAK
ncbi:MAG: Ig-like domain-containing protein, partial [Pirellula sp.]|nr:Ig-like domain-containing protein [Pirellula sp.]